MPGCAPDIMFELRLFSFISQNSLDIIVSDLQVVCLNISCDLRIAVKILFHKFRSKLWFLNSLLGCDACSVCNIIVEKHLVQETLRHIID